MGQEGCGKGKARAGSVEQHGTAWGAGGWGAGGVGAGREPVPDPRGPGGGDSGIPWTGVGGIGDGSSGSTRAWLLFLYEA